MDFRTLRQTSLLTHSYQEIHSTQVLIKIDRAQKLMLFGDDQRRRKDLKGLFLHLLTFIFCYRSYINHKKAMAQTEHSNSSYHLDMLIFF